MPLTLTATSGHDTHDGWTHRRGRVVPRPFTPLAPDAGARALKRLLRAEHRTRLEHTGRRVRRSAA